jgi:acyl-CoA thioesterase-1
MQSSILLLILNCLVYSAISTHALAGSSNFLDPKVLIMGDSLSAAYNISLEQSWPVLFQQKLQSIAPQSTLINASISGETSGGGAERLEALLNQHQPTHLILELGGNDGLRGYKFNQTRQHLASMITLAQQRGIQVLMIGVRLPPNLGPLYNQRFQLIFEQLTEQFSITYLPRFLEGIAADRPEYMQQDGIHPTALAQPLLADKVFNLFQNAYFPASSKSSN